MAKVRITFEPWESASDPKDATGLTREAFDKVSDEIPGENVEIERIDDDDA